MATQDIAPREKRCKTCDETKPIAEFYRAAVNRDGFTNSCRKCQLTAAKKRLADHPEKKARRADLQRKRQQANRAKHSAVSLKWVHENLDRVKEHRRRTRAKYPEKMAADRAKRRARLAAAAGTYDASDVAAIFALQKGKCAYCRKKLGTAYDVDHIIPLSRGGTNERKNIQITCPKCNGSKGAKHPIDFAQRIGRLV